MIGRNEPDMNYNGITPELVEEGMQINIIHDIKFVMSKTYMIVNSGA
jgi:hypothetical protein